MVAAIEAIELYRTHFSGVEKELIGDGQSWTGTIRKAALSRFAELGFPTTRDEEWKYTDVAPLAHLSFQPARYDLAGLTPDSLASLSVAELASHQIVFVNGHYSAELSSVRRLPQGIKLGSLGVALGKGGNEVEAHVGRYADYRDHAFVALNTALMQDGAFLFLPEGEMVKEPIHLLFIATAPGGPVISHPRNLIVIGKGCQATIVESYAGVGESVYFTNAVSEIVVGENAVVDHHKLQLESRKAFHVATLQAHVARNGNFSSHLVTLGGSLARNEVNVVLDGEGAACDLNGLYMVSGQRHVDNHTRIDHVKPGATSRELYKGILDGKSRAVFNGKIYVHKEARKTDAKQTNKNLLLSKEAWIDTKPQLEIYNNDVKCSHGSTIGQLDQDAIFYLRSRGIGYEAARSLLSYAFANDIIKRVKIEPLRLRLDNLLAAQFPDHSLIKELL